jgi:hypothetical protein
MTEDIFQFQESVNMNILVKAMGESLGATISSDPSDVKCKGIRIYFVDDKKEVLMSSGLFVKGFSPEDWSEENE